MKNILLFAVALLSSVQAQIQNVSTDTDDGSVIHFTTFSRLRGTTSSPLYKVYRLDGNGFRVLDEGRTALLRSSYQKLGQRQHVPESSTLGERKRNRSLK